MGSSSLNNFPTMTSKEAEAVQVEVLVEEQVEEQEQETAEALLEQELAELTLQEHEKILFDVHGIGMVDDLDDETFHQKLEEFEIALDQIPEKPAYDLAKRMRPEYVYDKAFRRMFLRSQEFDATLAAEVMVNHFETKRMVYGDGEILWREVRQSDLKEEDIDFLNTGALQIIPARDAAGRMIFCMNDVNASSKHESEIDLVSDAMKCFDYYAHPYPIHSKTIIIVSISSQMRPLFYIGMRTCFDEDAQRKGCIWIKYQTEGDYETEFKLFEEMKNNICKIIPCRPVGGHFCSQDQQAKKYIAQFQLNVSKYERFRIRHHIGTQDEINFELQTYGIPTEDLPMAADGVTWTTGWHQEWIKQLKEEEEHERGTSNILVPRRFDVLLGKTRRSLDHTGNRRLAHVCEMHFKAYCDAIKHKKTEMADRVVSLVHESGGRFLQWSETTGWEVAPDLVARNKVAHTFRFLRAKKQKETTKEVEKRKEDSTVSTEPVGETDNTSASEGSGSEELTTEKRPSPAPPTDILMYNPVAVDEDKRSRRRKV